MSQSPKLLTQCPACGSAQLNNIYSLSQGIPVHSVKLLKSREEALNYQTGKLSLSHCQDCGFIFNQLYDPDLQDYSSEYESTQAYSATFNAFARRVAQQLIDRYDLHQKTIIEIGCGLGEFLSLLCELGDNRGIGFDPAFDPKRSAITDPERVEIIPDFYSEKYSNYKADFVVCKMTLEHIRDVSDFVGTVRRSIGDQKDTTIFFQVPDVQRVLQEVGFWDIYYEHCSYFSLGSLARLFRSQSFEVTDLWKDYGDQYLMLEARPADGPTSPHLPQEMDKEQIAADVAEFTRTCTETLDGWKQKVRRAVQNGKKVILWGSGSKGVAFLTTLGLCDEIEYTVDINPNKHNTYMAGTGQKIVGPDFLKTYQPDLVILMNPVYTNEVREDLRSRGLSPEIHPVGV